MVNDWGEMSLNNVINILRGQRDKIQKVNSTQYIIDNKSNVLEIQEIEFKLTEIIRKYDNKERLEVKENG